MDTIDVAVLECWNNRLLLLPDVLCVLNSRYTLILISQFANKGFFVSVGNELVIKKNFFFPYVLVLKLMAYM